MSHPQLLLNALAERVGYELNVNGFALTQLDNVGIDSNQLLHFIASIIIQLSLPGENILPTYSHSIQEPVHQALSSSTPHPNSDPENTLYTIKVIEQIAYSPPIGRRCVNPYIIPFTIRGQRGISLSLLLNDEHTALDGADDRPLRPRGKKVTYRFHILGYDKCVKQCAVRHDTKPKWKSRRQLAGQVARIVRNFITENGSSGNLMLGGDIVNLTQLYLLELQQVLDLTWLVILGRL